MKKNVKAQSCKTIFDHIKAITEIQDSNYFSTLTIDDIQTFDIFLIQRFLSYCNDFVTMLSKIELYALNMTKEQYYKFMIEVIPKQRYWLNFPKKNKSIIPSWFIDILIDQYEVISKVEAMVYYDLLSMDAKYALAKAYAIPANKFKEIK